MAELADAHDSKSCTLCMWVRFPPSAPKTRPSGFFISPVLPSSSFYFFSYIFKFRQPKSSGTSAHLIDFSVFLHIRRAVIPRQFFFIFLRDVKLQLICPRYLMATSPVSRFRTTDWSSINPSGLTYPGLITSSSSSRSYIFASAGASSTSW